MLHSPQISGKNFHGPKKFSKNFHDPLKIPKKFHDPLKNFAAHKRMPDFLKMDLHKLTNQIHPIQITNINLKCKYGIGPFHIIYLPCYQALFKSSIHL